MIPLHPVSDTGLAAAIATLGIPLDPTQGLTRVVNTLTGDERVRFMFHEDDGAADLKARRKTEHVVGMWLERAKFERDQPTHPLVYMRAALDARKYLLGIVNGTTRLPEVVEYKGDRYEARHIREASILRAHGFPLLLATGRTFAFPNVWKGVYARQLIAQSQRPEGKHSSQWMEKYLLNYSQFVSAAKDAVPVAVTQDGDKTLLLSVEATSKTADKFHDKFDKL